MRLIDVAIILIITTFNVGVNVGVAHFLPVCSSFVQKEAPTQGAHKLLPRQRQGTALRCVGFVRGRPASILSREADQRRKRGTRVRSRGEEQSDIALNPTPPPRRHAHLLEHHLSSLLGRVQAPVDQYLHVCRPIFHMQKPGYEPPVRR
jgi:hypothetical protein